MKQKAIMCVVPIVWLFTSASIQANELAIPLYYDVHMHADVKLNRKTKMNELHVPIASGPNCLGGWIISPSYLENRSEMSDKERIDLNESISIQTQDRNNFLLCGTYNADRRVHRFLKSCLRLPKAIGVKMRSVYLSDATKERTEREKLVVETFQNTLKILNQKKSILLVHFDQGEGKPCYFKDEDNCLYGTAEDTQYLIDLLLPYPNVSLVIAHSAVSSFIGLDGLMQLSKSPIEDRVFIDTSAAFGMSSSISWTQPEAMDQATVDQERVDRIIQAWIDFGTGHVLYGSDIAFVGTAAGKKFVHERRLHRELIQRSKLLSTEDKEMIFKLNYEGLVEKLGL